MEQAKSTTSQTAGPRPKHSLCARGWRTRPISLPEEEHVFISQTDFPCHVRGTRTSDQNSQSHGSALLVAGLVGGLDSKRANLFQFWPSRHRSGGNQSDGPRAQRL